MQDLLQNGIDFREISDSVFRHSSSVVFDKEAIFSIHQALQSIDNTQKDVDREEFLDNMILGGGMQQSKVPSKSLIVRTYHAEEYKNPSDLFSPNQKLNVNASQKEIKFGQQKSKLEDINEQDEDNSSLR